MKLRTLKQHWTDAEIVAEVVARTGKTPVVTVDGLDITLKFAESLEPHEERDITTYFTADQDLPTITEKEARAALKERVRKVGASGNMSVAALRDVVAALAELAGVDLT